MAANHAKKNGKWVDKRVACHFCHSKDYTCKSFSKKSNEGKKTLFEPWNWSILRMYFSYLNGTAICMVKGRNFGRKKINFLFCLCHCLYLNNFKITVLNIEITIKTLIMQMDVCSNISLYYTIILKFMLVF